MTAFVFAFQPVGALLPGHLGSAWTIGNAACARPGALIGC